VEIPLAKGMLPTVWTPAIAVANNSRDAKKLQGRQKKHQWLKEVKYL
jgi:hypothetical protein